MIIFSAIVFINVFFVLFSHNHLKDISKIKFIFILIVFFLISLGVDNYGETSNLEEPDFSSFYLFISFLPMIFFMLNRFFNSKVLKFIFILTGIIFFVSITVFPYWDFTSLYINQVQAHLTVLSIGSICIFFIYSKKNRLISRKSLFYIFLLFLYIHMSKVLFPENFAESFMYHVGVLFWLPVLLVILNLIFGKKSENSNDYDYYDDYDDDDSNETSYEIDGKSAEKIGYNTYRDSSGDTWKETGYGDEVEKED